MREAAGSRVALYPGSFDPITCGHLDVLERATAIFDRVIVAVLENPRKAPLFSVDERAGLIKASVGADDRVAVGTFRGLTVEYARSVGAGAIVRGMRVLSDFENEFQMALMNRRLAPAIHTVFLMTSPTNVFISSTMIKEVCRLGGDVDELVPPPSAIAMRAKFQPVESISRE